MKIRTGHISNSSSSSFICRTKLSVKEVKEKLLQMLYFYNNLYETNLTFEQTFAEPRKGTKKDDKYLTSWSAFENVDDNTTVGKILVDSKDDNSIPYALFELIEDRFEATRIHLG